MEDVTRAPRSTGPAGPWSRTRPRARAWWNPRERGLTSQHWPAMLAEHSRVDA